MEEIEDIDVASPLHQTWKSMLETMLTLEPSAYTSKDNLHRTFLQLARKYRHMPSKSELGLVYRAYVKHGLMPYNADLYHALIKKAVRSASGILNVSVSLPPDKFSCKYNCYFCPNEPGMPRSYLSNEDVFKRASSVAFDAIEQVYDRLETLERNGHPIDKVEFRVLGGTFSCYDHAITDAFIRDLYYAANTYYERTTVRQNREKSTIGISSDRFTSLLAEQERNVSARVHVVGLGVETRPDEITEAELVRFRHYGVTRVELGVQHTDDELLRRVNRGHGVAESKTAIRLLKDYGFKVEIHIMADLPGATPEGDAACYTAVLRDDPDLTPDYLKDYPCLDVAYTKVRKWKERGIWTPYAERTADARDLVDVLIHRQRLTPPWVRVNRIQRDFHEEREDDIGYSSVSIKTNLAQLVKDAAEAQGVYCQCIRCCEVRGEKFSKTDIVYNTYSFSASGAREYFIAAQVPRLHRPLLLGFIRLRLKEGTDSAFSALQGRTALIRELHVYGALSAVGTQSSSGSAQHLGIGRTLLGQAEVIAQQHGYERSAIISGVGVRDYYRKHGYVYVDTYMVKQLPRPKNWDYIIILCLAIYIYIVLLH
jgi:ELP3 family radical SAM enzyme/protein acetyltransferase